MFLPCPFVHPSARPSIRPIFFLLKSRFRMSEKVCGVFEVFDLSVRACVTSFFYVLCIEHFLGFWCDQPETYSDQLYMS